MGHKSCGDGPREPTRSQTRWRWKVISASQATRQRSCANARILPAYLEARLAELKWAVIVQELALRDREEQRYLKEQERDRQKAEQERQKQLREIEREKEIKRAALAEAEGRLAQAHAEER